ncbi:hypothetical protein E2C01_051746 [Portunus trituberculatus]|uniref:Uncharacterized protein n=1 Tax=Portunus trituberculatus TaxID=210409 RepID=A0A5B7GBV0_PORTR|nr:hypothetical protein [Portunus trituberculatus]
MLAGSPYLSMGQVMMCGRCRRRDIRAKDMSTHPQQDRQGPRPPRSFLAVSFSKRKESRLWPPIRPSQSGTHPLLLAKCPISRQRCKCPAQWMSTEGQRTTRSAHRSYFPALSVSVGGCSFVGFVDKLFRTVPEVYSEEEHNICVDGDLHIVANCDLHLYV